MGRFFLTFFLTLVIGYFSILLSVVVVGFLFFGKYALIPSPERVPYTVPTAISWLISLLPGIWFVRRQARKGPAWVAWLGGALALGIVQDLFWGLMFFRMIG